MEEPRTCLTFSGTAQRDVRSLCSAKATCKLTGQGRGNPTLQKAMPRQPSRHRGDIQKATEVGRGEVCFSASAGGSVSSIC
eukprot:1627107-Amphidinium_carterae.1